jgi:hypothetical protein
MADPTLGLTFKDYQIRVAEYLGIADYSGSATAPPTDSIDLETVKRIVNDGYRRFLNEQPRWRFMTVPLQVQFKQGYSGIVEATSDSATNNGTVPLTGITMTDSTKIGAGTNAFVGYNIYMTHNTTTAGTPAVNGNILGIDIYLVTAFDTATGIFTLTRQSIGGGVSSLVTMAILDSYEMADPACVYGQNHRYYLPDDFGGSLAQPFTYDVGGPRIGINPVDEHRIRELRVGANTKGTPSVCAVRAINTTDASTGKRWELLVWPIPTGLFRVTAVYRRYPAAMSADSDSSVAAFQHDDTVLAACLAAAELQRNDTVGARETMYKAALLRSRAIDMAAAADKVSDYGDRSEDRAVGGRRPLNYYGVSTYNGSNIGDLT